MEHKVQTMHGFCPKFNAVTTTLRNAEVVDMLDHEAHDWIRWIEEVKNLTEELYYDIDEMSGAPVFKVLDEDPFQEEWPSAKDAIQSAKDMTLKRIRTTWDISIFQCLRLCVDPESTRRFNELISVWHVKCMIELARLRPVVAASVVKPSAVPKGEK